MKRENDYGINRTIPEKVKREVRQRCKFGCVICGFPIYEYEHFNPPFKDLKEEHKAEGITLLCPNCHTLKTNETLPVEQVIEANSKPFCSDKEHIEGKFYFKKDDVPTIKFAGSTFKNVNSVINIGSCSILGIKNSGNENEPFLLSGVFYDTSEKMTLIINQNNWISYTDNWDIEKVGSSIKIREGKRKVVLSLDINENKEVIIDRLQMQYRDIFLDGNKDSLKIYQNNKLLLDMSNCGVTNGKVGIQIGNDFYKQAVNQTTNFTIDS